MATLADVDCKKVAQILQSDVFALIPSNSDNRLQIHAELLVSVSPVLRAAILGDWEERNERFYKFEDTSSDTLICFILWAYQGDYLSDNVGLSSLVEEHERYYPEVSQDVGRNRKRGGKSNALSWNYAIQKLEVEPVPGSMDLRSGPLVETGLKEKLQETQDAVSILTNETSGEPRHPLILYAQIYAFGNIYLIDTLKVLSKNKITAYLKKVENAKKDYTQMIFDLLEYASLNLPEDDALMSWLVEYSCWKLEYLRKDLKRLDNLLTCGEGKFTRLFIRCVPSGQESPFS